MALNFRHGLRYYTLSDQAMILSKKNHKLVWHALKQHRFREIDLGNRKLEARLNQAGPVVKKRDRGHVIPVSPFVVARKKYEASEPVQNDNYEHVYPYFAAEQRKLFILQKENKTILPPISTTSSRSSHSASSFSSSSSSIKHKNQNKNKSKKKKVAAKWK